MIEKIDNLTCAVTEPATVLEQALFEQASRNLHVAHTAIGNAGRALYSVWEHRVALVDMSTQPVTAAHTEICCVMNAVSAAINRIKSLTEPVKQ